jgi:protein-tyrosine phosphatase
MAAREVRILSSAGPSLGLQKAPNARDLGGYRGAHGRLVRRGLLFRSDALHRLSDSDLSTLAGLGLACLIDMRSPNEVEAQGVDRLPVPGPAQLVALPLHDPDNTIFMSVAAMLGRSAPLSVGDGYDAVGAMVEMYRWFVSSPLARQTFAAAVRIIAARDALPLLFHCAAGKDRTGWLAAILLSALGVSREDVIADYVRTEEHNAGTISYLLSVLAQRVADPHSARPLLESRREYVESALAEADQRYGGMDGYLRDGLGLDDATLAALRSHLLEPPA